MRLPPVFLSLLFVLSLGKKVTVQMVDDLNVLDGSTESLWYCSKASFPKYLESFLSGIPFNNSFHCRLPIRSEDAKFDALVVEEVANLPKKKGSYRIQVINARTISKIFESPSSTSAYNFYCLSTFKSSCPEGFSVVQSMKEFSLHSPFVLYRPLDNATPLSVSDVDQFLSRHRLKVLQAQITLENDKDLPSVYAVILIVGSCALILSFLCVMWWCRFDKEKKE